MEFAPLVRSLWPEPRVTVIGYSNAQQSYVPSAQVLLAPDDSAVFPDVTRMGNYEGGVAFLWYGHPGLLTTDVDTVFMQGHADLLNQVYGPPQLSLTLSPNTVTAGDLVTPGDSAVGVVTLSHPSFGGPAAVDLLTSAPGFVTLPSPPQVSIPQGQTSTQFTIKTPNIGVPFTPAHAPIQASYQGSIATAILTVKSRIVVGILNGLTVLPTTVTGGQSANGTVSLLEAVKTDTVVGLLALEPGSGPLGLHGTPSAVARVPPQITIRAGSTTGHFLVTTNRNFSPHTKRGVLIQAGAVHTLTASLTVTL
jgi:hypothetical protein